MRRRVLTLVALIGSTIAIAACSASPTGPSVRQDGRCSGYITSDGQCVPYGDGGHGDSL